MKKIIIYIYFEKNKFIIMESNRLNKLSLGIERHIDDLGRL